MRYSTLLAWSKSYIVSDKNKKHFLLRSRVQCTVFYSDRIQVHSTPDIDNPVRNGRR